jgi:hypothetical protein
MGAGAASIGTAVISNAADKKRRHDEYMHLTPLTRRGVSKENLRALEQRGEVRLSKVDKAPNMTVRCSRALAVDGRPLV